jgi:hypothetical protein
MSFNTALGTTANTTTFNSTTTAELTSMLTHTASLSTPSTVVFLDALTLSASESVAVDVPSVPGLNLPLTPELLLLELLLFRL